MATFTGSGSINSTFNIILEVNETGTSTNDNTSTVSWVVKLQSTASYNFRTIGSTVVVNLNGSEIFNNYAQRDLGAYSTITIGSGTTTIWHNADGKKTIGCYASYTQTSGAYYTPGNMSCSGNLGLTTIPRQANITSAPDFNDEENPVLKYKNAAGNAVSTLQACISLDGTTANIAYRNIGKTSTSYTFNLTDDERKILRKAAMNSNTIPIYFIVKTVINGNTYTSKKKQTMSIINANPKINIPGGYAPYEDINPVTAALAPKYLSWSDPGIIRKASIIRVYFDFYPPEDAKKEALISKFRVTIGSSTAEYVVDYSADSIVTEYLAKYNGELPITGDEEYILGPDEEESTEGYIFLPLELYLDIYEPDSNIINLYATDTRGNTNTNNVYYVSSRYIEYTTLFENGGSIAASRSNNGVGTNVTLGISGKFWDGIFHDPPLPEPHPITNEIVSVTYKYKKTYEALWTDGTTSIAVSTDGANYSFSGSIKGDLDANGFDLANSYDIKVIVEDKLSTIEFTTVLPSATPGIAMHRQGVSFGAPYDKNSGGVVQIKGINIFQYIYPVGAVYISTTLVDPAVLFGGTWRRIEDRFLLAASEVYAAGSVGGEASHLLTESEMPKHRHYGIYGGNSERKGGYGSTGTHTGTLNENTATEYESFTTGYTGGGKAHNNMPPYLSVYMWERVS